MKIKIALLLLSAMLSAYHADKAVVAKVIDIDGDGVRIVNIDKNFYGFYDESANIDDRVILFINENGRIEYDVVVGK